MDKICRLIVTDSYFGAFSALQNELKEKIKGLDGKNLVFCEDKVSLMAERVICQMGGTFNTDVYSFGKFLHLKTQPENLLTKEGASMAVKCILSSAPLKRFSASRVNLAPTLYDLIMQLKSASVTPDDLLVGVENSEGLLKNKLSDIYTVFSGYEQFLADKKSIDQSARLSTLPSVILNDKEIENTDVYLLGYRSWTKQAREVVGALISKAKSVTAILTAGDNPWVYLNETASAFKSICKNKGVAVKESKVDGGFIAEGKILSRNLFNPLSKIEKVNTDKISFNFYATPFQELESVAYKVKKLVVENGYRYRDITVALPQSEEYKSAVKRAFDKFEIPYFLDEKQKPKNHPLIRLILAYLDVIRKNQERDAVIEFIKNPLICKDKSFADRFENYALKYNLNYAGFKKPLKLGTEKEREEFGEFLSKITPVFEKVDIRGMLLTLSIEEKLKEITVRLKEENEETRAAVNEKIYIAVTEILRQMDLILKGVELEPAEIKQIFTSGVLAIELSIIPQYSDAVFVGAYKEVALAKAKHLFAVGLDSSVPTCASDVALLSDGDISALENLQLLIEPKIQIVNDRERESVALAVCSFSERLYTSCVAGKTKSEIVTCIENLFSVLEQDDRQDYITEKQGFKMIADKIGKTEGQLDGQDSAFYFSASEETKRKVDNLITAKNQNKTPKVFLSTSENLLKEKVNIETEEKVVTISPSMLETYHDCPYKAFLRYVIGLNERADGELKVNDTGTFIHAVLEKYTEKLKYQRTGENPKKEMEISTIKVVDKISSDKAVEDIVYAIIKDDDKFKGIAEDETGGALLDMVIKESKKHAYSVFLQDGRSEFHPDKVEFRLGGENSVKLLDGAVSVNGVIDRIDFYKDEKGKEYFRIIDYKTGKIEDSLEGLYSGRKLQLYLYASAFPDKEFAGAYYYKLADAFVTAGKEEKNKLFGITLNEEDVIKMQDSLAFTERGDMLKTKKVGGAVVVEKTLDKETLDAYKKYAIKISELAVNNLKRGAIVASPCSSGVRSSCTYCAYKGICTDSVARKIGSVDSETVVQAVSETEEKE